MTYVAWTIAFVWFVFGLVLCGRQLNLMRLMFNNLAPDVNVGGPEANSVQKVMDSQMRPELFNAEGQEYLKKLKRNGFLFGAWGVIAFLLAIWLSPYFFTA